MLGQALPAQTEFKVVGGSGKASTLIQAWNLPRTIKKRTKETFWTETWYFFWVWPPLFLWGHSWAFCLWYSSLSDWLSTTFVSAVACSRRPKVLSPALLVTRACLTVLRFGMHRLRGSLGVFVGRSPPSPVGCWSRDQSEDGMQVVEMEVPRSGGFWVRLKVT